MTFPQTHRVRPLHRSSASLLTAAALAALTACGGGSDTATLQLSLNGLEDLGSSAVYEGWLIVGGAPVTTGRFSVNAQGVPSRSTFTIDRASADAATTFVLTIEPALNDPAAPSATHLLAGDFNTDKTSANLNIAHPAALGSNFASASGRFILARPTSEATTDEDQGIWFLQMVNGMPQAGIQAPTLPAGWVYEGWVVSGGTSVSTGRFTRFDQPDSDRAGPAAGPMAAPPFPGQDFVTPALRLLGATAVISIEPDIDNSPAPFTLKPLVGTIGPDLAPTAQVLTNTVGTGAGLPQGSVTLLR